MYFCVVLCIVCVVQCIFCVVLCIFVLFYVFLCCSMYFCVVFVAQDRDRWRALVNVRSLYRAGLLTAVRELVR
jgi:hypothetical protein